MDASINNRLEALAEKTEKNLKECILPVWRDYSEDKVHGGFVGKINEDLTPDYNYPKAFILMARELWTFCNMYRITKDNKLKELAKKQYTYIKDYFWDKDFGGVYFMLTPDGKPLELQKRTYAQAFFIYSFAEYYISFQDKEALEMAMNVFGKAEGCLKCESGGYKDTIGRNWIEDPLDKIWWMNPSGTPLLLNSHLHLFEAFLSLYKANPSTNVKEALKSLLVFLLDMAVDTERHHLKAGMDFDGTRLDDEDSYGHDAECCYLMIDAAKLLEDESLYRRTKAAVLDIMYHVCKEGIDNTYGGVYFDNKFQKGEMNRCKVWWCQAEVLTACIEAYNLSKDEIYLESAENVWDYIENNLVDNAYGEWYAVGSYTYFEPQDIAHQEARAKRVGREKASRVKCSYHSSRACMETCLRSRKIVADRLLPV